MTPADFQKFFPLVDDWMWAALAAHAGTARPVASCGFPRLPLYFTAETLASAKVVITDRLPVPQPHRRSQLFALVRLRSSAIEIAAQIIPVSFAQIRA
jgi:hypothetical protein